jgi:hypothetical protein
MVDEYPLPSSASASVTLAFGPQHFSLWKWFCSSEEGGVGGCNNRPSGSRHLTKSTSSIGTPRTGLGRWLVVFGVLSSLGTVAVLGGSDAGFLEVEPK